MMIRNDVQEDSGDSRLAGFFRIRLRIPEVSQVLLLFGLGSLAFLWFHGELLYFWDTIVPFKAYSDWQLYSYTWNPLFGAGSPSAPNEFGSFFPAAILLESGFNLSVQYAQEVLAYALFASSGLSMWILVRYIHSRAGRRSAYDVAPLASALFYMFNFYVALYLLGNFYPSWFLYSTLPMLVLLVIRGLDRAREGRSILGHALGFALTLQVASAGFWEPPYLGYAILILLLVPFIFRRLPSHRSDADPIRTLRFVVLTLGVAIGSSLWWLYSTVYFSMLSFASLAPGGSFSGSYSYLIYEFQPNSQGGVFLKLLNVIALYPIDLPASGGNTFSWISDYIGPTRLIVFVFIAVIISIVVFFPALSRSSKTNHENDWFPSIELTGLFLLLVFFGLQGDNLLLAYVFAAMQSAGSIGTSLFYVTNIQFLGLPLSFVMALLFGQGLSQLNHALSQIHPFWHAGPRPTRRSGSSSQSRLASKRPGKRWVPFTIVTLALVVVVVYPWYLWTPAATEVYPTGNDSQTIPSIVDLPPSFFSVFDYLNTHSDGYSTLLLPEGYNLFSVDLGSTVFADTAPVGLLSGSPVLYGNTAGLNDSAYEQLEQLMYQPNLDASDFSHLLATLNVRYVLLDLHPAGVGNNPYYNLSYLTTYLNSRSNLSLIMETPYFELFENSLSPGLISVVNTACFHPSYGSPLGTEDILSFFNETVDSDPSLKLNSSISGGVLNLSYRSYQAPYTPVYWRNALQIPSQLGQYNYLLVTFRTNSLNTWFYVQGNAVLAGLNPPFGSTILSPLDPTTYPYDVQPWTDVYESNTTWYTLAFPLYDQPDEGYTIPLDLNASSPIGTLTLALYLKNPILGQSSYVDIRNLTLARYVSPTDAFLYMESDSFNSSVQAIRQDCSSSTISPTVPVRASVTYTEVNPTYFVVHVSNAYSTFSLLFRQTFSTGWVASIDGVARVLSHYVGDGYANGWLINGSGNLTVTIQFTPQAAFTLMSDISVAFSAGSLVGVILLATRWLRGRIKGVDRLQE